jgi:hypothetical protein
MFIFRIYKSDEATLEDFANALSCARASVESVLYDHGALVTESSSILIVNVEGLTAQECKERIAGCFCDSAGSMYPEFHLIELQQ